MLLDYSAFSDFPAAKQIYKTMLDDGLAEKIVSVIKPRGLFRSKPNPDEVRLQLSALSTNFCRTSGFKDDLVNYVFNGGLVAIGIQEQIEAQEDSTNVESKDNHNNIITQYLVVNVSPKNASLYVDGVIRVPNNGVWVGELSLGNHSYRVENFPLHEEGTITLTESKKVEIDINLFSNSTSLYPVFVSVEEEDTEIFVDGVNVGRGIWDGQLSSGEHTFEAKNPKLYPALQKHLIKSKQSIVFHALKPKTGSISVNVFPVGSTIMLNGIKMGQTPLMLRDIPIGGKILVVKTEEGSEFKSVIDIRENQTTTVNESIETLFFDDYTKAKVGDFFYTDGALSHAMADNKTCIGIVISTTPHPSDIRKGWSHGYIASVNNQQNRAYVKEWGDLSLPLPGTYSIDDINDIRRYINAGSPQSIDSAYDKCNIDIIKDNPMYGAIHQACLLKHLIPLPKGKTSGWYLPSIQQLIDICKNIYEAKQSDNRFCLSGELAKMDFDTDPYGKSIMSSQRRLLNLEGTSSYHGRSSYFIPFLVWSSSIDSTGNPLILRADIRQFTICTSESTFASHRSCSVISVASF